jgi:signal peptidase I
MDQQKNERPVLSDATIDAVLNIWADAELRNTIPVDGGSMRPFLQDGDQAQIKHGVRKLRTGNVVVFRQDNQLVAHRLLTQRSDGFYLTKGDNVQSADPLVAADRVVGRVVAVQRGNQVMRLDSFQWQAAGWFIAVTALYWLRMMKLGRRIKRRLIGDRSLKITGPLQQLLFNVSKLLLKVARPIVCRWQNK